MDVRLVGAYPCAAMTQQPASTYTLRRADCSTPAIGFSANHRFYGQRTAGQLHFGLHRGQRPKQRSERPQANRHGPVGVHHDCGGLRRFQERPQATPGTAIRHHGGSHSDFRRSIRLEKRAQRKRTSMVENRRHPIHNGIYIHNGLQSFCPVNTAFSTTPTYHQGGSRRYSGIKASFKVLRHPTHYHSYGRGYSGLRYHSGCPRNVA